MSTGLVYVNEVTQGPHALNHVTAIIMEKIVKKGVIVNR